MAKWVERQHCWLSIWVRFPSTHVSISTKSRWWPFLFIILLEDKMKNQGTKKRWWPFLLVRLFEHQKNWKSAKYFSLPPHISRVPRYACLSCLRCLSGPVPSVPPYPFRRAPGATLNASSCISIWNADGCGVRPFTFLGLEKIVPPLPPHSRSRAVTRGQGGKDVKKQI